MQSSNKYLWVCDYYCDTLSTTVVQQTPNDPGISVYTALLLASKNEIAMSLMQYNETDF